MPHTQPRDEHDPAPSEPRTDRSLSIAECSTFCAVAGPASQVTLAAVITQTYETLLRDRLSETVRAQLPRDALRFRGLVGIHILRRHAALWPPTSDRGNFIRADLYDLGLPKHLVPLQVERHYLYAEGGNSLRGKAQSFRDDLELWPSLIRAVQQRVNLAFSRGDRDLHTLSADPVYHAFASLAAQASIRDVLLGGTHLMLPRVNLDEAGRMNWTTPVQLYGVRDSLPSFHDRIPSEDIVSAQIFIPALSPHQRSFVNVNTYAGKWLAMFALSSLMNAESRIVRLGADQADECRAALDQWAVALLELVMLLRLHSEAVDILYHLSRDPPPPALVAAKWTSLGRTVHSVDEDLYAAIRDSLERRRLEGHAARDVYDAISWGSFAECCAVFESWIRGNCKLELPESDGRQGRYLRSLSGVAGILFLHLCEEFRDEVPGPFHPQARHAAHS